MGPAASCIKAPAPAEGVKATKKAVEKTLNDVAQAVEKTATKVVEKAVATVTGSSKKPTLGSAVLTPFGVGIVAKLREDGFAVVQLDFGAKAYINPDMLSFAPVPKMGEQCSTVYGDGAVTEIREADGFVVVKLEFGATAFLRPDQVRPRRSYPFVPASYWTSGIFARPSATVKPEQVLGSPAKAATSSTPAPASPVKTGSPKKGSSSPAAKPVSPAGKPASPAATAVPAPASLSPVKAAEAPKPADPTEEKDASEVPPPAQAEPPVTNVEDDAEPEPKEEAVSGSVSAPSKTSTSAKKKKKKGKN